MPSGQQFFSDEKKPALGRAGWESQKELDVPFAVDAGAELTHELKQD